MEDIMRSSVDMYLDEAKNWQKEMRKLREIVLDSCLVEGFKWGKPCYTYENKNILVIIGFKETCAFMFFKGALLKDPHGILIKAGENTQGMRQLRFTSVNEIIKMESIVKSYIKEAIEVEKSGLKINDGKKLALILPEEFQSILDMNHALKDAFMALTPGRQRAYNIYFSTAKQSKTRISRIEKCIDDILDGKGLTD